MKLSLSAKNIRAVFFITGFLSCVFCCGICGAQAQDNDKLAELNRQITQAKSSQELSAAFNELKEFYFKDNKYAQMVEHLKSLSAKDKTFEPFADYYIALGRYSQLKYLEEKQSWDEYFAKGNAYRDEITSFANKAIGETGSESPLRLSCRLLLWQFHKGQEDALSGQALSDLMQSALEYARAAQDPEPIKKAAQALLTYGEKLSARELYKLYLDKLVKADTKAEELKSIAAGLYEEGNLELAESAYDIYLERIKAEPDYKEKALRQLINIGRQFSYKDQGTKDPDYAEKVFKKIEEIGGQDDFSEELMYLRGFNLEKIKDYAHAAQIYAKLLELYPQSLRAPELNFKLGLIQVYAFRDIEKGKAYFERLAQPTSAESAKPWLLSSLYQLGLISQWQGDLAKARDYYNLLIGKLTQSTSSGVNPELAEGSGSGSSQIRLLAEERLKEIEGQKPIEYNLKMFLDVSLKEENPRWDPSAVALKSSAYQLAKGQSLDISAVAYAGESGCMQPQLTYLWSGDLGEARPQPEQANFSTKYLYSGTKVINLVVVSSAGVIIRAFDMLDVN